MMEVFQVQVAIITHAYRLGMNLPEVGVGDIMMTEAYQTVHTGIGDRTKVFTDIHWHFWERSLAHEAYHFKLSYGLPYQ